MGIVDDSAELLTYIYKEYTKNDRKDISPQDIKNNYDWKSDRIDRAIKYLNDENLIKINILSEKADEIADFVIYGLPPKGIKTIEDKKEFKSIFGIEAGIPGFIKAIWTKEER